MPMTTTTMPTTTDPVTAVLPDGTIGAAPPGTPSTSPAGALPNTVPAGQEPLPAIPAPINRARSAGVVNDNSVSRNEPVTIGGSGFAPGALATITYRGVRLGIAYADANGAVVATVSIDMPRGSGRLEISGPWATPTPRRPTKYVSAPVRIRRS
jgi:hypothetical protein